MSSEKCDEAKKFHEREAEAVLDDCRLKASVGRNVPTARRAIQQRKCRSSVEKSWIHGMPKLEKPTIEWVEEQIEAAGSRRK